MNGPISDGTVPSSPPAPRPVFAIFEGGGAKGVAHIGAAEAVLAEGLEFIGIAGASAGAFVASLLAAGYRGAQLFDPNARGSDLLSKWDNKNPIDLLGAKPWASFQAAMKSVHRLAGWAIIVAAIAIAGWVVACLHPERWALVAAGTGLLICMIAYWRCKPSIGLVGQLRVGKGHFDTRQVREFVNFCLRKQLLELYAAEGRPREDVPERVLFEHLDYRRFKKLRPLKIIATDVQSGKAALFSQDDTPEVEVGEAVAASIAIPVVFRPVRIGACRGSVFADGGLTYNLPVGVFMEEKLAYERRFPDEPPVPVLAFLLEDSNAQGSSVRPVDSTLVRYLYATARTAIFGSQEIGRVSMPDLVLIRLRTELGLLGFDAKWTSVVDAVEAGRLDALQALSRSLRLRPAQTQAELHRMAEEAKQTIDAARGTAGRARLGRLRLSIIIPSGRKSLRVAGNSGIGSDCDDRFTFDRDGPGIPQAFRERDLIAFEVTRDAAGKPQLPVPWMLTKYERALLWSDLRSVIALPIFVNPTEWKAEAKHRGEPVGVLVFDSDENLLRDLQEDVVVGRLIDSSVAAAGWVTYRE